MLRELDDMINAGIRLRDELFKNDPELLSKWIHKNNDLKARSLVSKVT